VSLSRIRRGLSCSVSAFRVRLPPRTAVTGPHEWLGVATVHVTNPSPDTGGRLTPEAAILAGAVMEVVEGRASAESEEAALEAALRAALFQLNARRQKGSVLE